MKKIISACLFLGLATCVLGQNREVLTLPAANENFFKEAPVNKVRSVLEPELKAYFSQVEFNDKMKEQWGVRSLSELQSLTYKVILPVLGYYEKDGKREMGNADQFYVPLMLNGEIKLMASVSRMQDGYHVTNIGWPLMGRQLNAAVSMLNETSHLAYVELPDLGTGALVLSPTQQFRQSNLRVLQVIYPGREVADTKMSPLSFDEFIQQSNTKK